ncbi:MAG: DUF1573 domain-containing protein [Bacteroidaceae bacterium]|nr:DUF1573 domain-containing protein [Bacteroidaceae bacterium]
MKRLILSLLCMLTLCVANAKKMPEIKFEKTTIDLGTFSQDDGIQKCVFRFTNVGNDKLIINNVHTSCGCTVAKYSEEPISPGGSGEISITYNGAGKMPGKFKKSIQVFTNCEKDMVRLFIMGYMSDVPSPESEKKQE